MSSDLRSLSLDPAAGLLRQTCLEPAAGTGDLARGLRAAFGRVTTSDVHDWPAVLSAEGVLDCKTHGAQACPRGCRHAAKLGWDGGIPAEVKARAPRRFVGDFRPDGFADFLDRSQVFAPVDWVVTNPPFNSWLAFAERALALARVGVALFLRLQWMETIERYLFCREHPPALIASFAERVPLAERRLDPEQGSATAYCWVVFLKQAPAPSHPDLTPWLRIGPCRGRLLRPGDYAAWSKPPSPSPLLELAGERGSSGGAA